MVGADIHEKSLGFPLKDSIKDHILALLGIRSYCKYIEHSISQFNQSPPYRFNNYGLPLVIVMWLSLIVRISLFAACSARPCIQYCNAGLLQLIWLHGRHATKALLIISTFWPIGRTLVGSAGPKKTVVGTPSAAAICAGPLSIK